MAAAGGVKRRDAHQTVYARLSLEEAVGVFALDDDIRGLEAGFFAVLIVHDLVGEAVALGPAGVHTVQHLAPVLRLSAARTRVEGDERVQAVVRLDLALERAHAGDDLLALLRVVPESRLGGLDLKLLDLALCALQAERLVQVVQLGREVVQFYLVFLELQHEHAPS